MSSADVVDDASTFCIYSSEKCSIDLRIGYNHVLHKEESCFVDMLCKHDVNVLQRLLTRNNQEEFCIFHLLWLKEYKAC